MVLLNFTFVDPLGETGKIIYPTIGTIMTLAIIFNFTGVIFMQKNRELRKHNQNFIFTIISLSELFTDVFYLVLVFWRQESQYVCSIFFSLFSIGRHNVFTHILYMCVERFCAINPSLNRLFHQLITRKSRIIFLGLSLTTSCLIFLPFVSLFGRPSYTCSPEEQFGEKTKIILGIIRTLFSVELLFIFGIYVYLAKKINSLRSSVLSPKTTQADTKKENTDGSSSKNKRNVTNVISLKTSDRQQKSIRGYRTHNLFTCISGDGTKRPNHNSRAVSVGKQRKWKMRAFKMLRCAILTTVIPSIPLILIQFLTIVKPSFRSPFLDLIVSLCNISHAIVYSFVFMIRVKHCKRNTN